MRLQLHLMAARLFSLYRFRYLWSNTEYVGVLAREVPDVTPHAVLRADDNFRRVDYVAIGMEMMAYAAWAGRTEPPERAVAA
jgi:hypothetical protein